MCGVCILYKYIGLVYYSYKYRYLKTFLQLYASIKIDQQCQKVINAGNFQGTRSLLKLLPPIASCFYDGLKEYPGFIKSQFFFNDDVIVH